MSVRRTIANYVICWVGIAFLAMSGCSRIRLPAIDPSGERIFLPPPASTTLADLSCIPKPAFQDVPVPPPCGTAGAPSCVPPQKPACLHGLCGASHHEKGIPGRLQLSPTKLIAPIGSEVVLLSGLCGDDGYLVTKQPIEFTLSQESVGQFVDAAQDDRCLAKCLSSDRNGKLAANFVIAHTSQYETLVTRGTPNPNDDVPIARGQTWASVSSPSEGTTFVTVLAPNAASWDRRRQTAVIHWVDAQWTFPAPTVAPAGDRVTLTTRVTRSDGTPLPYAWAVRYEILNGTAATFGPRGESAIDVPTDPEGRAAIEMVSPNDEPGASQIRIQIIRPATNNAPRLVVGEGFTSVTWRAAGLAIQLTGPQQVLVGQPLVYRAIITNPGDIASTDVVINAKLPPIISYVNSNRPVERIGDGIQTRLGDLAPQASVVFELQCRAEQAGSMTLFMEGASREGRRVRASTGTDIIAPAITLRLRPDRDTVEVGSEVIFLAEITNTSDRPLSNVDITSRFDDGLEHVSRNRSPLVQQIQNLLPNETQEVKITFRARRPGQLCTILEATAPSSQQAATRACVTAVAAGAQPRISVNATGPAQRAVNDVAPLVITVSNSGNVPLTNVRINALFDATSLSPKEASPNYGQNPGEIYWVVQSIAPGETAERQVNFQCRRAAPAIDVRVAATSGTVTADNLYTIEVFDGAPGNNRVEGEPPAPGGAGALQITLDDLNESVRIGERNRFRITVKNDRTVPDRGVLVRFIVPRGLKYAFTLRTPPSDNNTRVVPEGIQFEMPRVNEMRPGETLDYEFEVEGAIAGTHVVKAQVFSQLVREGVVVEEETIVVAN